MCDGIGKFKLKCCGSFLAYFSSKTGLRISRLQGKGKIFSIILNQRTAGIGNK